MVVLHPDRGGTSGTVPKLGVVVHDSEGGENSVNLLSYLASPGDRLVAGSSPPRYYGGGYNAVATEDGSYEQIAGGNRSPYHAPPLNYTWWSVCIPGRANQTREQWLDERSRAYIRGVARFIVDKWHEDGERWPLTYRDAAELKANLTGYTSHAEVSRAWGLTNHTDPGPAFPWDVLAADIAALVRPPDPDPPVTPGGDLKNALFIPTDCDAQFYGHADDNGNALWVEWTGGDEKAQAAVRAWKAAGIEVFDALSLGGFINCTLLGPLPTGDTRHVWTGAEFRRVVP